MALGDSSHDGTRLVGTWFYGKAGMFEISIDSGCLVFRQKLRNGTIVGPTQMRRKEWGIAQMRHIEWSVEDRRAGTLYFRPIDRKQPEGVSWLSFNHKAPDRASRGGEQRAFRDRLLLSVSNNILGFLQGLQLGAALDIRGVDQGSAAEEHHINLLMNWRLTHVAAHTQTEQDALWDAVASKDDLAGKLRQLYALSAHNRPSVWLRFAPPQLGSPDCEKERAKQAAKRKRADERAGESLRAAWGARRFCDGVVVCGEKRWDVHRHVVCAESEVMDAAFSTPMQEAKECLVTIDFQGATPEGVELMLEYMYTKELRGGVDCSLLLPLAHFYQMEELTSTCARQLAEAVTGQNVVAVMRMLNKYKGTESVDAARDEVLRKAANGAPPNDLLLRMAAALM